MQISALLKLSRPLHHSQSALVVTKYTVHALPTGPDASVPYRLLVRFDDELQGSRSHPDEEIRLLTGVLSLVFETLTEADSAMVDSIVGPPPRSTPRQDRGVTPIDDLGALTRILEQLNHKDLDVARQVARAAGLYRVGLSLRPAQPTLSVFLFSVAIECVANVTETGSGTCDRFLAFLGKYCSDFGGLPTHEDFAALLREIYYRYRSGFTHGGKDLPAAAHLADQLGRAYVRNELDGKEVRSPGPIWFGKVVRTALLSFVLAETRTAAAAQDVLKVLSLEVGTVKVKARRDIAAHTLVTPEDFDLE